ncbi:MAG: protein arginine kinase activator [Planctomycetota bacterium]|jgi:protein arginine kinase activator
MVSPCATALTKGILGDSDFQPAKATMPIPICENCHNTTATVTVIELQPKQEGQSEGTHTQQMLCEMCAQSKDLPHSKPVKNAFADIWKLLASGQKTQTTEEVTCPSCGMTRAELRERGRIGCAKDYELFASDIATILERVHGAKEHVGRVPGISSGDLDRMQTISSLRRELVEAIEEEAYESAARIRDQLQGLGESA